MLKKILNKVQKSKVKSAVKRQGDEGLYMFCIDQIFEVIDFEDWHFYSNDNNNSFLLFNGESYKYVSINEIQNFLYEVAKKLVPENSNLDYKFWMNLFCNFLFQIVEDE